MTSPWTPVGAMPLDPAPWDPRLEHLLAVWMPRQRWYPAKGRGVGTRLLGATTLSDPGGAAHVQLLVLSLDSGDREDVIQVPVSTRTAPLPGAEDALVGVLDDDDGRRWVYDGPHDPVCVAALLGSLVVAPGAVLPSTDAPARVLGGEQSNTSIVVDGDGPAATVLKVFRTLHPGANPDVEVTAALAAAGCDRVASVRGWLAGGWTTPDGRRVDGHLAVAVEYLAGSQDAWDEAVSSARGGEEFGERSRAIGHATATVHAALADAFGHAAMSAADGTRFLDDLRSRVDWALASAPALQPYTDALGRHRDELSALRDLPDLQRIHGDLHLGQVLHSPARGWILLDFEGEPLRPLAERTRQDLTLRDLAGMLRSFDYASRLSVGQPGGPGAGAAAERWVRSARDAFCAGYTEAGGADPGRHMPLLRALEIDKALYEVVYETRNRPQWLDVPLQAIARALG